MDSTPKENRRHEQNATPGGDYGYGGYAGYSAVGYGSENTMQRSFNDYVLILRERVWYIIVVFLVVLASAVVYTLSQTKLYEGASTVQILRRGPIVIQAQEVVDDDVRGAEDLNTQVKLLESASIIDKVSERLTGEDLRRFLAPYEKEDGNDKISAGSILAENRKIVPQRLSLLIGIQYRHPDPTIAAKVSNMFVDEYLAYNARQRIDASLKAEEDLRIRAENQRKRVEEMATKLQQYREKNNMVSLDQRKDIVTDKLRALNLRVTQTNTALKDAEVRWQQVQEIQRAGGDLADLAFISSQPLISSLVQQTASQQIEIARMRERYRAKHPQMISVTESLAQTQKELDRALNNAATRIRSEYETTQRNDKQARLDLAAQESESMDLDRAAVDYEAVERELRINEQQLENLMVRMRDINDMATMDNQNARVVDKAVPSSEANFVSPNYVLNIGLGVVGGAGLGLAFAFFVAFIDDRVKSSFDIESVIGLPLVGIIPQIKKMDQPEKAQIVVNNSDRQVSEAFLTLHSGLRLNDESKNAKCMLTTSTIPGEGKSFTTTNLALTFAAHGDRTVVVDCDLRKPNINKSFRLENVKGVIDIVAGTATIEDVVFKNVHPNLDVITTGGRAKNPTQILNSSNFERFIADLRTKYDRILIDTPPLAAVSDALIVLPLVDGSLFTIFFNKVRRKAAQFAAKRLMESNVPVFGAVLNGLNLAVSGYYYAQYYDKSYKDYYVVMSQKDDSPIR